MSPSPAPLAGQRVIVTRAAHQAGALIAALEAEGAEVEPLPLLEVGPPADAAPLREAARAADTFDWLVLTSVNTVDALSTESTHRPRWPSLRVAAVGPATARAAEDWLGRPVDLVSPRGDGADLARGVVVAGPAGGSVLLPQAADARPETRAGLEAAGLQVTVVEAYATRCPTDAPAKARAIFRQGPVSWVTLASPKTVERFVSVVRDVSGASWPTIRDAMRLAVIGRTTAAAARQAGFEPVVATTPSVDGLVTALLNDLAARSNVDD